MTWLTWRQHRWEALIALAGAAGLVALFLVNLAPTEHYIQHALRTVKVCAGQGKGCFDVTDSTHAPALLNGYLPIWYALAVIPALFGIFVGAPLVAREYESGTHRLVWAQGVTCRRWLATKVGWAALATILLTGVVAAAATVYSFTGVGTLWSSWDNFDDSLVLTGHALFALALGIAAGALLRRTLPAMALTLGLFVVVRVAVTMFLRPYFQWPLASTKAISQDTAGAVAQGMGGVDATDQRFNRVVKTTVVDAHGHALDPSQFNHGVAVHTLYQPADRFWLFQGIETLIFVGLAVALIAFAFWWVRRSVR